MDKPPAMGITPESARRIKSRITVKKLVHEEIIELGRKIDQHLWEIDRLRAWMRRQSS